ncbi:hypothetical protein APS_0787 [Acetobacter pasteurianus subsp. pasteurianus LMG 1262 = NBRC 106471]|nr:hypothetical protein APS_0787 [Acetobacter pasteurianus subsp. pasteurianus LMG 1262 = NBRC 106471]
MGHRLALWQPMPRFFHVQSRFFFKPPCFYTLASGTFGKLFFWRV